MWARPAAIWGKFGEEAATMWRELNTTRRPRKKRANTMTLSRWRTSKSLISLTAGNSITSCFADVLEHLRDPAAVLRRCIPALKESGKIIISVPNIANWIIRLGLLFGKFDYMDRGILDRTHLRFFTMRSLNQLMSEVSCEVLDAIPTPLPGTTRSSVYREQIFQPLHEAHYALTRCWKTFFAYQFVIVAAPCHLSASSEFRNCFRGRTPRGESARRQMNNGGVVQLRKIEPHQRRLCR